MLQHSGLLLLLRGRSSAPPRRHLRPGLWPGQARLPHHTDPLLPPATPLHPRSQWAPGQLAGVFATATFEGQLGVSSLSACTAPGAEADGFAIGAGASAVARTKAPAWLRRPAGAAFGFGGRLVQFANSKRQLPAGELVDAATITVKQVRPPSSWAACKGGAPRALLNLQSALAERQHSSWK